MIISIQHLFLFIKWRICHNTERRNISIQHLFLFIILLSHASSVVSMISIQHLFLFILGLGSNTKESLLNFNTTLVFIYQSSILHNHAHPDISIQHLFLFIMQKYGVPASRVIISIQHLFLFINMNNLKDLKEILFQYNTCFYLSEMELYGYKPESIFQYNTCFYLSNVFPPFLISIIVIFPDKFNVSLNFSQPFLFFRYFLSNRLPTAMLSGLPAFRIFFRLGKPIKAAHPAAFILHYLN